MCLLARCYIELIH